MRLIKEGQIPADIVREPGAVGATIRRLIDTTDGADRFVLSLFELAPSGSTPPHYHDWEHEVYVLDGVLQLELPAEGKTIALKPGDAVFIPRDEQHAFTATANDHAKFLVVAPTERPPVRNVFLAEAGYRTDGAGAEQANR